MIDMATLSSFRMNAPLSLWPAPPDCPAWGVKEQCLKGLITVFNLDVWKKGCRQLASPVAIEIQAFHGFSVHCKPLWLFLRKAIWLCTQNCPVFQSFGFQLQALMAFYKPLQALYGYFLVLSKPSMAGFFCGCWESSLFWSLLAHLAANGSVRLEVNRSETVDCSD